ncbi:MAG: hypothetical protein QF805_31095, partial [Pirellulaceae bacterium]|nr:hypothetical protein [Pirellulaceae bacterium]
DIVCGSCPNYGSCMAEEKTKGSSLRNCQKVVCESFYAKIENKDVLEVGCGTSEKGGFIKKTLATGRAGGMRKAPKRGQKLSSY